MSDPIPECPGCPFCSPSQVEKSIAARLFPEEQAQTRVFYSRGTEWTITTQWTDVEEDTVSEDDSYIDVGYIDVEAFLAEPVPEYNNDPDLDPPYPCGCPPGCDAAVDCECEADVCSHRYECECNVGCECGDCTDCGGTYVDDEEDRGPLQVNIFDGESMVNPPHHDPEYVTALRGFRASSDKLREAQEAYERYERLFNTAKAYYYQCLESHEVAKTIERETWQRSLARKAAEGAATGFKFTDVTSA